MDFDITHSEPQPSLPVLKPSAGRTKSSQRMKYEAEIRLFRTTYGGLEDVRLRLGLSQRKICQLLLVDPSAWTRWGRDEAKVPPHIYRALEWYISLAEKEPGKSLIGSLQKQWRTDLDVAHQKIADLATELKTQKGVSGTLTLVIACFALVFAYFTFLR